METFVLYKDNKLDQKYKLTADELKEKCKKWLQTRDPSVLIYTSSELAIISFVCGNRKKELNSTPEDGEFDEIKKLLIPLLTQYINGDL